MLAQAVTLDDEAQAVLLEASVARTPNRTRQALLGFLSWGPQTGYGLRKIIDGSVSTGV